MRVVLTTKLSNFMNSDKTIKGYRGFEGITWNVFVVYQRIFNLATRADVVRGSMNYRTPRIHFSIFFCDETYRSTSAGFPTIIFPLYMTPLEGVVCAR